MFAKRFACCIAIAATSLAASLRAQCRHDPVPTRISFQQYGRFTGTPSFPVLGLELDARSTTSAVTISNGQTGDLACTVLGTKPARFPLPFDAIGYVVPDLAVLPGLFDHEARCPLPLDLAETALIGQRIYCQGFNLGPPPGVHPAILTFQASPALVINFHEGNAQPDLTYLGPVFRAVPVQEVLDMTVLPEVALRTWVIVPSEGHEFRLDGVQHTEAATMVYLTIVQPKPEDSVRRPQPVDLYRFVEVGQVPTQEIRIWITVVTRDQIDIPFYQLAAVVRTDY